MQHCYGTVRFIIYNTDVSERKSEERSFLSLAPAYLLYPYQTAEDGRKQIVSLRLCGPGNHRCPTAVWHLSPANATIANAAYCPASAFSLVKFVCQRVDVQQTVA